MLILIDGFIFLSNLQSVFIQYQQKSKRRFLKTLHALTFYDYFGPALESEPLQRGT